MEVNPSFPAMTVPEFIVYAKANPGKLNYASGGVGTIQHVCGELFKIMAGVNMVHVPYRGGAPAIADLLAGQVQVMFDLTASSIEYIRAGSLRSQVRRHCLPLPWSYEFRKVISVHPITVRLGERWRRRGQTANPSQ
jgi:tripartite-type tricarboxylate transporter receptor subunit TctC